MNNLFHDVDLGASCLVDLYPHTSLEGAVEVVRHKEFDFLEGLVGGNVFVAICHV